MNAPITKILTDSELLVESRLDVLRKKFGDNLVLKAKQNPEDWQRTRGNVFETFVRADPSNNKRFVQWMVTLYLKGQLLLEDLYKATEYLTLFMDNYTKLPPQLKDINKYKSLDALFDVVSEYKKVQTQREVNRELDQKMHSEQHVDVIYNSSTMKVLSIKSHEASCYFGTNTEWCTANKNPINFRGYIKRGPLFFILVKKENTRFLFHYENGEFMDENNRRVDVAQLGEKYPELSKALGSLFNKAVVSQNPEALLTTDNLEDDVAEYGFNKNPDLIAKVDNPTIPMIRGALNTKPELVLDLLNRGIEVPDEMVTTAAMRNLNIGVKIPKFREVYHDALAMNEESENHPSIMEQYKSEGFTMSVLYRMDDAGDTYGLSILGYEPEKNAFAIEKFTRKYEYHDGRTGLYPDIFEFVSEWFGIDSEVGHVVGILYGSAGPPEVDELPPDWMQHFLEECKDERLLIGNYFVRSYNLMLNDRENSDAEWEGDFDPSSIDDIIEFINLNKNDMMVHRIKSAMGSASYSGYEHGAESEMYRAFADWMENIETDSPLSASKTANAIVVYVDSDTAVEILSSGVGNGNQEIDDWKELEEFTKFRAPHYGWHDFDSDAAADRFHDEAPAQLTEVPEYV